MSRALHGRLATALANAGRSVRGKVYGAFLLLVALGALHTGVAQWATWRRHIAFRELQSAVARQRALVQVAAALEEHQQRISVAEVLESGGSGISGELRERLSEDRHRLLQGLDSAAAMGNSVRHDEMKRLRNRVATLLTAWDAFYRDRPADATRALIGLVSIADPLAGELLREELPAAIRGEEEAVAHAGHAFAQADRSASRMIWIIFVLSATFGTGVAYFLARDLLRRVASLKSGAERLRAGDLDYRIHIAGRDELGDVAASFNDMAESLYETRENLEQSNHELASTVQRLEESRAEVVQAEKLRAMGGMLAGLAHELNNPLASVLGYGELIQAGTDDDDAVDARELSELARLLVMEALRARDLVRNMLQFSRKSVAHLVPVNVASAMNVAASLRSYAFAQSGLSLEIEVPPDLWVIAEPQKLQQVFMNLMNNAFHALNEGGGTGLRVHATALSDDLAEVHFEDDGPGFADPERALDPFYTTKPVGQGTGLGLTLVHRFQEEFGGSIFVRNNPHSGARISLRYMLTAAREEERAPHECEKPFLLPRGSRCVLIVDDEAPLRQLQAKLLSRLKVDVVQAESGLAARDILLSRNVDAVISDVKMPGDMNGAQLFSWICDHQPELKSRFLFVTGDVHDATLAEMQSEEPDRFITKPFQMEVYLRRVAALLNISEAPMTPLNGRLKRATASR